MRRFVKDIHDDQSYDSFLDIVANLVGILVILIMVIGVRAQQVVSTGEIEIAEPVAAATPPPPVEPVQPVGPLESEIALKIQQARATAEQLNTEVHSVASKAEDVARLAAQRAEERNQLQLMVSMAEQSLEKRRQALGERERVSLVVANELESSRVELARLQEQLGSVQAAVGKTEVLEHHPTPMAKTVFGNERHFRLLGGRLAYVPITEMRAILDRDGRNKLWKMATTNEVTELIGPQDGFMMKYTLRRTKQKVDTPEGPRVASFIDLKRFAMVPQSSGLGETIDQALAPGSKFERKIAELRQDETTITVWTYPDSYGDFRRVRARLIEKGFLTAARPLPDGYPIGGAADGTKSSAQ